MYTDIETIRERLEYLAQVVSEPPMDTQDEIELELLHKLLRELEYAPTANVVEVKHGEWREIIEPIPWCDDDVDIYYECSLCHSTEGWRTHNFCPNCGADMRKEEENDL